MATPILETEVQRAGPENYSALVLAIIENGVTDNDTGEGTSYLETDGGQYWCGLLDIDPSWLQQMFIKKGYLCRLSPKRWR